MRILSLSNKGGKTVLPPGVFEETIDKNDRYEVSVYYISPGAEFQVEKNYLRTFYVLDGFVAVQMSCAESALPQGKMFNKGGGWVLLPGQTQVVKAEVESKIFAVKSSLPLDGMEIMDRAKKALFRNDILNELSSYTVNKPWGSEQWFVDTGAFVFKGITMNSGHECSLQIHEQKIEVNLVLSGKIRLMLGYNNEVNAAIAAHHASGGNQANFPISSEEVDRVKGAIKPVIITPGEGWKAMPYEIHQVLSLDTYFALEVSTSEVDDIIRLKDLYNRQGGRIASEHQQK